MVGWKEAGVGDGGEISPLWISLPMDRERRSLDTRYCQQWYTNEHETRVSGKAFKHSNFRYMTIRGA